jgi:hypothetical protein
MAVDLMGGGGGGEPPGWNWDRDDSGDEYQPDDIDEEEQQEEQQEVDTDTEEETVATPDPVSVPTPTPAPARRRPLNVVYQDPLVANTNRERGVQYGKKPGSGRTKSGQDNKTAKNVARSEKGGIRYGQGTLKLASKLGVKPEANRPHTGSGTGNTGLAAHETRNGGVANRLNRKVDVKLKQKGKASRKVVTTEMLRKEKRDERERRKKK